MSEEKALYKDKEVIVFPDKDMKAKIHLQVVPFRHIQNIFALQKQDVVLIEKMKEIGATLLYENGCRRRDIVLGFHIPPYTSVDHLHMHAAAKVFPRYRRKCFGKAMAPVKKVIQYLNRFGSVKEKYQRRRNPSKRRFRSHDRYDHHRRHRHRHYRRDEEESKKPDFEKRHKHRRRRSGTTKRTNHFS
ncbi:unnamed protein product [Moneuplotes crassus]|uniref:HIT domain-containing protein n=1 Tax=Euplotes crassus TaxID=5936 RepID=A0AAD2D5L5_EUPCR|nr:unnamed protein product [Moneuplotes crassus]